MTVVCSRCETTNSSWDRRCRACWLPLDVASQAKFERSEQPILRPNEKHVALAAQLEIEVAHVEALAKADIHTLEHVVGSMPAKIAHALRDWSHIDPEKLIARARALLATKKPVTAPPAIDSPVIDPPESSTTRRGEWWTDAR